MPNLVARYTHPQGATIELYDNDAIVKRNKAGKVVATSATADKLRAGHGGWMLITDTDAAAPTVALPKAKAAPTVTVTPMKFKEAKVSDLQVFVVSDAWALQQKLDGIRAQLVFSPSAAPWFRNSTGGQLESAVGHAVANPLLARLGSVPEGMAGYVVDGEILGGAFWVFDLVFDGGERTPFADRMLALSVWHDTMVKAGHGDLVRLLPTTTDMDDKARLAEAVHAQGGEGWIAKRLDSTYDWGQRVEHSLKLKITHTVDVVVMERNRQSKANMVLGVYRDGAASPLTEIGCASAIGKPNAQVGDVVEVKYLYVGADGRLVQPTVLRLRNDKPATECVGDDLRFADKSVVTL